MLRGPSEVLVLDKGEPVRISDLARRLVGVSGHNVDFVYTGPGQREEELVATGVSLSRSKHPPILQT